MLNLPNLITITRLFLTALFVVAVSIGGTAWAYVAAITFFVAAVSDYLDGYLARKLNLVTALGKLLDPLADKILVCSGFVYLTAAGFCPVWVTCVILGREFMVTGLRQIAVEQNVVLAADNLGKWKTTTQLIYLIGYLTHLSFGQSKSEDPITKGLAFLSNPDHYIVPVALWSAVALTVISGWNYLWSGREMLKK